MIPLGSSVPVYDCHILLRKPRGPGERFQARCARAPEVIAEGATERETLQSLVIRFKYFLEEHRKTGTIPWREPALSPEPDEVERFIPVHL